MGDSIIILRHPIALLAGVYSISGSSNAAAYYHPQLPHFPLMMLDAIERKEPFCYSFQLTVIDKIMNVDEVFKRRVISEDHSLRIGDRPPPPKKYMFFSEEILGNSQHTKTHNSINFSMPHFKTKHHHKYT